MNVTVALWYQGVGIVFAGNLLTALFGYFVWQVSKAEREGRDTYRLPVKVYASGAIPLLFVAWSLYMAKP